MALTDTEHVTCSRCDPKARRWAPADVLIAAANCLSGEKDSVRIFAARNFGLLYNRRYGSELAKNQHPFANTAVLFSDRLPSRLITSSTRSSSKGINHETRRTNKAQVNALSAQYWNWTNWIGFLDAIL